ncbi:hypothetical protein NLI96_g2406 [Meripilus lineatus]|uniref:Rab-GAP TBC domain-containing protein n=1 Tax=Meripilus lineatus TaxID=2056292 RepID=A0AAD5VB09_9APHY|nr:hypothetical protein NLI96_g2406 [Physisporinus lineatus]
MAARPPPARPHIGLNPSPRFASYSSTDWAEDDAWDSASDEDTPSTSGWGQSVKSTTPATSPKPVPKPQSNSSSSTLASSFTHLHAPSPSSYPPKPETLPQPSRNGWTMVRKENEARHSDHDEILKTHEGHGDVEVEGDMIIGEMDPDIVEHHPTPPSKHKHNQGTVRDDADEIVNDPLYLARPRSEKRAGPSRDPPRQHSLSPTSQEKLLREQSIKSNKRQKFIDCICKDDVDMTQLRKFAWNGVPNDLRPAAWPLLLGYLPLPAHLRASALARKRQEYLSLVELAFARNREGADQQIWHQIEIDVPRTRPGVRLWMQASTQRSLERILYVWAIRHPASGYVQGINDLVTPFFQVFLSAYIDSDPEEFDPTFLPSHVLNAVEADSFWCLSRLLDGIQDNYIATQPGIHRSVKRMAELVARIDRMSPSSSRQAHTLRHLN